MPSLTAMEEPQVSMGLTLQRRSALIILAMLIATGTSFLLDRPVAAWLADHEWQGDSYKMFRVAGFEGMWLGIALVVAMLDRRPARFKTRGISGAMLLTINIAIAVVLAAMLKLAIRRVRPPLDGEFVWYATRSFGERSFDGGGLTLPSEHTALAFAGALLLSRLYPRVWPILLAWAIGCGFSRVAVGAHYVSDVVAGAAVAAIVTMCVWQYFSPWVAARET